MEHVKILFRFYSTLLEETTVETVWTEIIDEPEGLYKIANVPFYIEGIATDDIIRAEYSEDEEMLVFRELITPSGNSTIQVVVLDRSLDIYEIIKRFADLGFYCEKLNEGYFVIQILAETNYSLVRDILEDLFEKGIIDYAESCLSDTHRANAE